MPARGSSGSHRAGYRLRLRSHSGIGDHENGNARRAAQTSAGRIGGNYG